MTVSSNNNKNTYAGNGSTVAFSFNFKVLDETHISVSEINNTTGVETVKTLTTDYTVSGTGNTSGRTNYTSGTVTMGTAPASGVTLVIKLGMPFQQNTDYVENDTFPAETHEEALDELTLNDLELKEEIERTVKFNSAVSTTIGELPTPAGDKYLKRNSANNGWEFQTLSSNAGLGNLVEDTTPQAGADLDFNGFNAQFDDGTGLQDDSGNEQLTLNKTAGAVNEVAITNAATGNAPSIDAEGDDTNIDLNLDGKGSGVVKTSGSDFDVTGNIIVSGTVDGRDVAADGSKLDTVETSADVTDETNVKAALDGATLTTATVATGDKVLIQDVDDSDNLKTVTAQSIADLAGVGGSLTTKSTTYTAATDDDVILVDTSSAGWTLTLYAASGNAGKRLTVIKTSSDWNTLTVDGNASETINGNTTTTVNTQYEKLKLVCDGTNWIIEGRDSNTAWAAYTPSTQGWGTISGGLFVWRRVGDCIELKGTWTNGTVAASEGQVSFPDSSITVSTLLSAAIQVGYMSSGNPTSDNNNHVIATGGDNFVNFVRGQFSQTAENGNTWNNSELMGFSASVPVDAWKGANE